MLDEEQVLAAYRMGIFPMAVDSGGKIGWFSPDPRGVIPLDDRFHIPHGLKRTLQRRRFTITADREFRSVIRACSTAHGESWISDDIIRVYVGLHRKGYAHSIEVWSEEQLVGGLYGIHIGGAFFGESMFHAVTDASKVALVALVERLRAGGSVLLDTQWVTPHLQRFGAFNMPRREYLICLQEALAVEAVFS